MSLTHRSPGAPDRRFALRRTRPLAALAVTVGIGLASSGLAACSGSGSHPAAGDAAVGTPSSVASPSPSLSDIAAENAKPGTTAWSIADSAVGPQNAILFFTLKRGCCNRSLKSSLSNERSEQKRQNILSRVRF